MIKCLRLQNFQSHKDTTINLSTGVNAIVGKSDSGKSAIFRALYWVINNRPSGDAFRSHWGGDTIVTITMQDGTVITRFKGDKDNYYQVGDVVYRAIGSGDPPAEVTESLRIGNINTQTQMDAPFLLGSSSGEVARYLNKIVNLDAIDETVAKVNKELLETKRNLVAEKSNLVTAEKNLEGFANLDKFEQDCEALEGLTAKLSASKEQQLKLKNLLFQMEVNVNEVSRLEKITAAYPILSKCLGLFANLNVKLEQKQNISAIFRNIKAQRVVLDGVRSYITDAKVYATMEGLSVDLATKKQEYINLFATRDKINRAKRELQEAMEEQAELSKLFAETMPEICPLCEQEVKKCEPSHQRVKGRRTE